MSENYFQELNSVNVSDKVEKKNGLSYLSWAWAWGEVKKRYPDSNYKIYETEQGCIYWTDGRTAWVKTGVTVNGVEHIEYLPVMDFRNNSIPVEKITSFDVNKAIQRSLTKAVARHGLGLYIYAGEDLPEEDTVKVDDFKKNATSEKRARTAEAKTGKKSVSEMTLDERYELAIAFLDKQTEETYPNATGSYKDSVNNLITDLNKVKDARAGILQDKVNQLMQIEEWSI